MRMRMSQTSNASQYKALDVPTGEERGQLKRFGGSENDDFNYTVMMQATDTAPHKTELRDQARLQDAALGAMIGMQPRDEFEGVLITQLLGAHHAAMECYRIGMDPARREEIRQLELNQANKLTRTRLMLVEPNRRRSGTGQTSAMRID